MTCVCNTGLTVHQSRRYDPTQTTTLRRRFEGEAAKRFRWLKGQINDAVIEQDGFGLRTNRGRFEFERSSDKISAFMEWLREQERRGILEVSQGASSSRAAERAWSSTYVRSAYQRGMAQSAAELRKQGAEVADEWVTEAFTRPFHVDRVGLAATRTFEQLQGITDTMSQQISRVLSEGLSEGKGMRDIARAMNERVDKIGITRARMLARTEVVNAHAEASLNSYEEAGVMGVDVRAEFATAGDAQVCPECEALEGQTRTIDDARGVIPLHPNCLPGDSLVLSRSGITAVSKRWFDGDMIIINTASGRKLTCTPNHPILTARGWLAAKLVHSGDDVISDSRCDWATEGSGNNKDVPSRIEDVAEAFRSSRGVSPIPVPVTAPHFHGDGLNGDVAQIWADWELRGKGYAPLGEHIPKQNFVLADIFRILRECFHSLGDFGIAAFAPPYSVMSGENLCQPLAGTHIGPFEGFSCRPTSNANARRDQAASYRIAVNSGSIRDRLFAFTGSICLFNADQFGVGHLLFGHHLQPQEPNNDFVSDAMLARKLASGEAGPVFQDKVAYVDTVGFSGHVYNLESGDHSYIAQGIFNHNCRCAWIPMVENPREVALR